MKLITTEMILRYKPCSDWTEERIREQLGSGKTLLEIADMKDVEYRDRIWCITRFLPDKTNRKFAIWCARQCKTRVKEIKKYIDVIERYYAGKATKKELNVADSAAYWAAYLAACDAADAMVCNAADRAACNAACNAADIATMRKKQIRKLKELIKEASHDD